MMGVAAQIDDVDEPSGVTAIEAETVDRDVLLRVVGRLATEASDLGLHLVDIAGTIQDTAAQSSEHAALLTKLTQAAEAIAAANGEIARSVGETDKLAARELQRAVEGKSASDRGDLGGRSLLKKSQNAQVTSAIYK